MITIIIDVLSVTFVQVCGIVLLLKQCLIHLIRRAGTILNQPFVQEHLAILIKEKENLQEALHAK